MYFISSLNLPVVVFKLDTGNIQDNYTAIIATTSTFKIIKTTRIIHTTPIFSYYFDYRKRCRKDFNSFINLSY